MPAFVLAPKTGPAVQVFAGFRALDIGLAIAAAPSPEPGATGLELLLGMAVKWGVTARPA